MDSTRQARNEYEEQSSLRDDIKLPRTLPVEDPYEEQDQESDEWNEGTKLPGTVPVHG